MTKEGYRFSNRECQSVPKEQRKPLKTQIKSLHSPPEMLPAALCCSGEGGLDSPRPSSLLLIPECSFPHFVPPAVLASQVPRVSCSPLESSATFFTSGSWLMITSSGKSSCVRQGFPPPLCSPDLKIKSRFVWEQLYGPTPSPMLPHPILQPCREGTRPSTYKGRDGSQEKDSHWPKVISGWQVAGPGP